MPVEVLRGQGDGEDGRLGVFADPAIQRVGALIDVDNVASGRVLEKIGRKSGSECNSPPQGIVMAPSVISSPN